MKKILLLLGVLVISANSFSAASIVGGGLNIHAGTSISGSSNYNLGTGPNTVTATGSSTISAGTKFTVPAGGNFRYSNRFRNNTDLHRTNSCNINFTIKWKCYTSNSGFSN